MYGKCENFYNPIIMLTLFSVIRKILVFIGKILGILLLSLIVVLMWYLGTDMTPMEQYNTARHCVLGAQANTGMREQEIIQFQATRLFIQKEAWVQVVNLVDNTKTDIFCTRMKGKIEYLLVDGKEIKL